MNVPQRKALLRYHPKVSKAWRRWYRVMLAEGVGADAARERADIEATKTMQQIESDRYARFERKETQ